MSLELDSETVETAAGEYAIRWIYDEFAGQPYDEGFEIAVNGGSRRIDIREGVIPSEVDSVLRMSERLGFGDYWESDYRSGAALVRWLTLKGFKGVTVVDEDYDPVPASANRFERIHGVAWAPDDATDPEAYVKASLEALRAWATGDTFGWQVEGPGGDVVEDCWGYYGLDREREYTRGEAMEAISYHVEQRQESASLVGAGIVGII